MTIAHLSCILLGDQTVLFGQTDYAVIGFTHTTDFTTDGIGLGTIGHAASFGVNIDDVDLNGSVILSVDDSVGSRAANGRMKTNGESKQIQCTQCKKIFFQIL